MLLFQYINIQSTLVSLNAILVPRIWPYFTYFLITPPPVEFVAATCWRGHWVAVALLAPAAPAAPAPAQAVPQSVALGAAQALGGAQPMALVAVPAVRVGVVTGELVQMATGALEGAAQPWLCWDAVTVEVSKEFLMWEANAGHYR